MNRNTPGSSAYNPPGQSVPSRLPDQYKLVTRALQVTGAAAVLATGVGVGYLVYENNQAGGHPDAQAGQPHSSTTPNGDATTDSRSSLPSLSSSSQPVVSRTISSPAGQQLQPKPFREAGQPKAISVSGPNVPKAGVAGVGQSHTDLNSSGDEFLRTVAKIESQGWYFDAVTQVLPIPADINAAEGREVAGQAARIKERYQAGFRNSMTILQPSVSHLNANSTEQQAVLDKYLTTLKSYGVTTEMLGRITIVPESNSGLPDVARYSSFADTVDTQSRLVRQVYPGAHLSALITAADLSRDSGIVDQLARVDPQALDSLTFSALVGNETTTFAPITGGYKANTESNISTAEITRAVSAIQSRRTGQLTVSLLTNIGSTHHTAAQRQAIADGIVRVATSLRSDQLLPLSDVVINTVDGSSWGAPNSWLADADRYDPDGAQRIYSGLHQRLGQIGIALGLMPAGRL